MAATGIGLLILAFGSLVVWLNKSESGAKVLSAAFEAVGNVINAVTDAIVFAGDGIASFFGMASDSSSAVKGVNKLEEATKTLGKRMDELAVKEAKNQRARDDYNRTADDTSKSQKTRMDAADKGSAIELQNIDDKIQASKDYAIVLEAERVKVNAQAKQIWKIAAIRGKATEIVDEQVKKQQKQETELAKLELERHNASLGYADKQVEIRQTAKEERDEKINDEKERAKQLEEIQNELDLRELETAREVEEAKLLIAKEAAEQELEDSTASKEVKDAALLLLEEKYQSDLAVIDEKAKEKAFKDDLAWSKKIADNDTYNLEQQKKLDDAYQSNKEKSIAMGFAAASSLAKEGSGVAKGIAVAETIYNTQAAIMQAMKLPPPFNAIQAAATGVMGAASIAKILSTNPEGAGGGGGGAPVVATPPAPEMMSGAFELTGGQAVEPARAYVVSDDITANQDKLAIIRRRATI
jgi:myosin heavy subunit